MPDARYALILFDADDTLFDFGQSEQAALRACLGRFVEDVAHETAYAAYQEVSAPLWRALEERRIAMHELGERRFAALAERCGFGYSVPEIAAAYLKDLAAQSHLVEGALAVCSALAQRHELGLVSNGFEAVQRPRLAASPLAPFFRIVVTSEAAGAAKPSPLIFERALELYGRPIEPRRVLMIGDNLRSDVGGAQAMGFATCWFNARGKEPAHDIAPDHTIATLHELLALTS